MITATTMPLDADIPQLRQEAGADRRKDQDGHAVADPFIGNKLRHPHNKACCTGHNKDHHAEVADRPVRDHLAAAAAGEQLPGACCDQDSRGLQYSKPDSQVPRIFSKLCLP